MNLFLNSFISALFCHLLFYSAAINRISDKRKCANADCSEPVSLATTLVHYFADDDRLVSFPRNIQVEVYSKEAGDNPQFWEVKEEGSEKCMNYQGSLKHFLSLCQEVVSGKRGYVPKGFLREDKVLIPRRKLTHIVPTGRINIPVQNTTDNNLKEQESNVISETPKLPVANSKGLFSTIGGVSADSVPMNPSDIKPQSTRKFEVVEGTTLYDDVVSEKSESPPIIIDDTVIKNKESYKKPTSGSKESPQNSNVPSQDVRPVNEEMNENEHTILTEQKGAKEVDKLMEEGDELRERKNKENEKQPEESNVESQSKGIIGNIVSMLYSGAGEDATEEEYEEEGDEEGSAEEEYEDDVEENTKTVETLKENAGKELSKEQQPESQPLDSSKNNVSELPNFKSFVGEHSSVLQSDNTTKSEIHYEDTRQGIILQGNDKAGEELKERSGEIKSDEIKIDTLASPQNTPEIKEEFESKPTEVEKFMTNLTQGSESLTEEKIKLKSYSGNVFKQPAQQNVAQDLKKLQGEITTENDKAVDKETKSELTDGQFDDVPQLQTETISIKSQDQPRSDVKEQSKVDEPHVKTDEPEHGKYSKSDELQQTEEEPKTDKPDVKKQLKTDESQTDKQTKTGALEVPEQPKTNAVEVEKQPKTNTPEDQKQPNTDASEGQEQPKTNAPDVEEQLKTDAPEVQKQPKTDVSEVQEQPKTDASEGQEQQKTNAPDVEEQSKTDASEVQGQLNTVELQVKEESKTDEPQVEEQPETVNVVTAEEHRYETSETPSNPELRDETKPQDESLNETTQVDNLIPPDPPHSSLPPSISIGSPKYSSVINKQIQGYETTANEVLHDSEESEEPVPQSDDSSESVVNTSNYGEMLSPQSQSPKYSSVVNRWVGSHTDSVKSETSEAASDERTEYPESAEVSVNEEKPTDMPTNELVSETEIKHIEEVESEKETDHLVESSEHPVQDMESDGDGVLPADGHDDTVEATISGDGMFSWVTSLFEVFGSKDSGNIAESSVDLEDSDPSRMAHFAEETCSADGIEGSCPTLKDTMQKEVTWQEFSYSSDMWELMERVPLEATIWLVVTAVVVLIFSLGHYYIEAHRRDGPLVAIINKLEREVLILKKESCIMEDRLQIAQQQLEAWNTSSSENDALLVELKQELEETKAARAELEEQVAQLKEELETVTESGLEMHRLLEESLSSQDGSQVLLSTVETLREKLQRQEEEISGLSDTLSSKNAEVEHLQNKLSEAADVAHSLEEKVISVTREKEEEIHQMRNKHRELISQLEEVMETKALEETRLSTEMSKLRLTIEELQKSLAEKDSELDTLKEVVKQLRATDSNEKIEALFDVVAVQAKLKTAVAERDDFREKFMEEEGARKLLEGHMKRITQEVGDLKNSFETAEKEKIEALTKLQVLSNYFKEKESQLQKELGLQESMWLQKQSDDHTIYEQMRSLREENEKYKLQNESLKKEIVEQEASFKIQLANTEQKAHENWVASRQAERKLKETQQEAAQLRNRLTTVEKNSANYSLEEKPNISESNGDPSSPPPSLMFPPTTSPPFMMYGPPIPPGDFVPPPPLMGSPYPSDSRPPPLGRISSPPLDRRFSPPPPLPYPPYDYPPYGHHSPSPPPPLPPHHRNVHKPQPREMSREQKDHVPNYSPEAEKTSRRNKR